VRITSLQGPHGAYAAVVTPHGPVPIRRIADVSGDAWPATVQGLLQAEKLTALHAWLDTNAALLPSLVEDAGHRAAPLLQHPPKILGVGLNYAEHAGDLGETRPDEPATFMKPYTSIIAAGETIPIPRQSERTTGEAELGLVMGAHGKDVAEAEAASLIAGVTTIIDMTAEDILQRNPRFLTRAKSFDGFLVLGPDLVTLDELPAGAAERLDLNGVEVTTLHNGAPARRNVVANMLHSPAKLVAFFSAIMPLEPGDVISTGTPGAVPLAHGDTVGCAIPGVGEVTCPVVDRKVDA